MRVGRGTELFLQAVAMGRPAAQVLRGKSEFHPAAFAPQRSHQLREIRRARSFDFTHGADLGRSGAERAEARPVCVVRRVDKLHNRRWLSGHSVRTLPTLLAGRSAYGRQGYLALPCGLLAGVPDGCRFGASEADFRPWLVDQRRAKNIEVGRQRDRSLRTDKDLWAR